MIFADGTRVKVLPGAASIIYEWIPAGDDGIPTVTYSVKKYEQEFSGYARDPSFVTDLRDPKTTTVVVDDAGVRHVFTDDNAGKYVVINA